MPRLTADVLLRAPNYLNTLKERELCLRGYKVADIENLAVLQDQFDLIDLSDNELRALENFPGMPRLSSLFASNNYVSHIGRLGEQLRNLTTLVLSNNRVNSLSEIDNIATLNKLELLSLTDNQKVKRVEREEAVLFFGSAAGKQFLATALSMAAPDATGQVPAPPPVAPPVTVMTEEQKAEVRNAIQNATTREEVDLIEKQLRLDRER